MTKPQHHFIEDLGHTMVSWGLSRTTGRAYAYMLLRDAPVSLDDIARELGVAKSGVSLAARQLVALGIVRGVGARGTRRVLYEALLNPEALLAARSVPTRHFLDRLHEGARVAPAGVARRRLEEMAGFIQDLTDELPLVFRRIRERRRA